VQDSIAGLADQISAAREGDRTAFAIICERTLTPVFRYVYARVNTVAEAEEITQEVFLAATTSIRALRADDELGLLAWLYQIARHKLADHLRHRYRLDLEPLEAVEDVAGKDDGPESAALAGDERRELVGALAKLTPEQREVLVCKYVLDYDNQRVGALLKKTPNAINQLHHRALDSLRKILTAGISTKQRSSP
jgi:RNA polymerase sigma-70 factor, ECF subfamily